MTTPTDASDNTVADAMAGLNRAAIRLPPGRPTTDLDAPLRTRSACPGAVSLHAETSTDFWAVWERHRPHLFRVCLRAMNGNRADAEDALGQLMLKARAKIPVFAPGIDHVGAWLTRFAYNHCVDLQRKRRRDANLERRWEEIDRIDRVSDPQTKSCLIDGNGRAELQHEVNKAIARLPARLREPVTLRLRENLSYREIAVRLGRQVECVRKQVQQGRDLLRRDLSRFSDSEEGTDRTSTGFAPVGGEIVLPDSDRDSSLRSRRSDDSNRPITRLISVDRVDGERATIPVFLEMRPSREKQKIATLRAYIDRHPTGWTCRLKLANLLYETGEWDTAAVEFRTVLRKRAWLLPATLRLGNILHHTGRRGEAAAVFEAAIPSARTPADAQLLAGMAAWMKGNYTDAVVVLRKAADLAAVPTPYLHALARCWLDLAAWAKALDVLDESLGHDPQDMVALSLGYDALLALGREDEARRRVREVLRSSPNDPLARLRLRALRDVY